MPLATHALRTLLHDALDAEPLPDSKGAAEAAALNAGLVERLQRRVLAFQAAEAAAGKGGAAGSTGLLDGGTTASPRDRFLLSGVPVELGQCCDTAVLAKLHVLAKALQTYMQRKRLPIHAVFGSASTVAVSLPLPAADPKGAAVLLSPTHLHQHQLSSAKAAATQRGASADEVLAPLAPPPSPYLCAVLALLRSCDDVYLDVVSSVGRTVEEERLPALFPAAGTPRQLFREALRRAAEASGSVASTPIHNRRSLRHLRTAAALMLLVQEFAWRQHIAPLQRDRPSSATKGKAGGSAGRGAAAPAHDMVLRIVLGNLDDATDLLTACGLDADLVKQLVGPKPKGLGSPSMSQAPAATSGAPVGADGTALPAQDDVTSLEARITAVVKAVCDHDPATQTGLKHIIDSATSYCERLRTAAVDFVDGAGVTPRPNSASSERGTAPSAAGGGTADAPAPSSSGGGLGLFGTIASYLGFGGAASSSNVVSNGPTSAAAAAAAPSSAGPPAITGPDSDPIVQTLWNVSIPLLVATDAVVVRAPESEGGTFRIELAALKLEQVVPPPAAAIASARSAAVSRRASSVDDFEAVLATLSDVLAAQAKWLHQQTLGAKACVSGLLPGNVIKPVPVPAPVAGTNSSSVDASDGVSAVPPLAVGDILMKVGEEPVVDGAFSDVVAALQAAPKETKLTAFRVVPVTAMHILRHILAIVVRPPASSL
jgi:hypothetical protein